MLDAIDLAARIDPEEFAGVKDALRARLNQAQIDAWQAGLGVVVILEGWDFSGKAQVARFLTEPLDPRGLVVHVLYPPTRQERRYPITHRYATRIPARKQIGLFVRSWYYHALDARVRFRYDAAATQIVHQTVNDLERSLADDGYLVVKFWLHIDRKEQKRRRKAYRGDKAQRRLRTGPDDPKQHKRWKRYAAAVEDVLAHTDTEHGRWHVVAATDVRHAQAAVARTLCEQIEEALATRRAAPKPEPPPVVIANGRADLDRPAAPAVFLERPLAEKDYQRRIDAAQARLTELHYQCVEAGRAVIFALEGFDAAGKGGVIRRLTGHLDPRFYAVWPIAAPSAEEAEHHYLWRFWKRLPPAGHWTIFDRTWYGRVLVERVEGYARPDEWRRAYREINTFEAALHESRAILLKYFLNVSAAEQLKRFQAREQIAYKQFKITPDDWRNRDKRPAYVAAVEEMLARTNTLSAPWTVLPADDKHFVRVALLEDAVARIEAGLRREPSPLLSRIRRK